MVGAGSGVLNRGREVQAQVGRGLVELCVRSRSEKGEKILYLLFESHFFRELVMPEKYRVFGIVV